MFKFLENFIRNNRMKRHQQNFTKIIKQAEKFVTPDDPDFPWVRLRRLRQTSPELDKIVTDIEKDYERNEWRHQASSKRTRKNNAILTFIEEYAPEVTYRQDPLYGLYVTTQIITTSRSEKSLDIEFGSHHLELTDYNGKLIYDLRCPIEIQHFKDLYAIYNLRVVDDETGTYQTVPRTNAQFKCDVPYELWDGMAQHKIRVSSAMLVTDELVTYKRLPKVSPDDNVKRTAQFVITRAIAYLDIEFENDELERVRKCAEIATNLLEGRVPCKNNN